MVRLEHDLDGAVVDRQFPDLGAVDQGAQCAGEFRDRYAQFRSAAAIDDDGELRLTPNHLVWLEDDWRPASVVEVGDELVGLEGPRTVRDIDEQHERITVRTLHVGAPNSFFAEGVWVHNY